MAAIDAVAIADTLQSMDDEKAVAGLEKLSSEWMRRFEFSELDSAKKSTLVTGLCHHLESSSSSDACKRVCLEITRLLSRDKVDIELWIDDRLIRNLITFAALYSPATSAADDLITNTSQLQVRRGLALEARKALCNVSFQCQKARKLCIEMECLEKVGERFRKPFDKHAPDDYEYWFYDLRLLFLLTALCADIRSRCRDAPVDGLCSLTNILQALFHADDQQNHDNGDNKLETATRQTARLSEKEVNLACETLKVAFNLVLPYKVTSLNEGDVGRIDRLTDILHDGLFVSACDQGKREEVRSNIVNLLAAVPSSFYERLTPPVASTNDAADHATSASGGSSTTSRSAVSVYEGRNMEAVQILLDFLNSRLDKPPAEQLEMLSPILTLLIDMARKHRRLRKYMRFKVLPPLTDVMTKPEEGNTIRNKLVRLMTSVTTEIKDLAADYLFELCGRSIDRLIKYTGFGNAAGMLSAHGLLATAVSGGGRIGDTTNSDDDENSDTEEYIRVRDQINPIIGCYEPPRPDPMAGMSEEQKEYEAMKLVEQIDKLMKKGVVVPGRLGEDGRVHPVEHILQLAEESERSGVIRNRTTNRSSSDDEVD